MLTVHRGGLTVMALALAILLGTTVPAEAGRCPAGAVLGPGGKCIIPVTTTISDVDSNGLTATIAGDGLGPYVNSLDGATSWLTSNGYNGIEYGDWQFGIYDSTVRNVSESLLADDAVSAGDPHYTAPANPPFWGTQALKAHIEVKCTLVNKNMLTMTAGQTFTCPLPHKFNYGGTDFRLDAAPSWSHYPETTDVEVRCNTTDAGGCNDWFIDPISLTEAVGRLVAPAIKHNPAVNEGDFYMRFHIHITRP